MVINMENKENPKYFNFRKYFEVGDIIYGFCNGFFGRDDYNDKEVFHVSKHNIIFKYIINLYNHPVH